MSRRPGDGGSGTVLLVAVLAVVAPLVTLTGAVGQAALLRHRVSAAADLAALAAASRPSAGCRAAARVAAAQDARVVSCHQTPGSAGDVQVAVGLPPVLAAVTGHHSLVARARAASVREAPGSTRSPAPP